MVGGGSGKEEYLSLVPFCRWFSGCPQDATQASYTLNMATQPIKVVFLVASLLVASGQSGQPSRMALC